MVRLLYRFHTGSVHRDYEEIYELGVTGKEEALVSREDSYERPDVQAYAPQWVPESPFLRTPEVALREPEAFEEPQSVATSTEYQVDSPFTPEMRDGAAPYQPEAEEFVQLLAELEDATFNEALADVMNEVSSLYLDRFVGEYEDPSAQEMQEMQAELFFQEHLEPLNAEAEALLDNMARGLEGYDPLAMSEAEMEDLLNQYEPIRTALSPSQEYFLKNVWKKAKGAVKGAINLAKKGIGAVATLGLGPLLGKLKGLIRPLLKRVLKSAINKLPPAVRPAAQRLAKRFLGETAEAATVEELEEEEPAAHEDPSQVQQELDGSVAELLFASEESEQDATIAEYAAEFERPTVDVSGDLDRARSQFVAQLGQLEQGEDPTPQLEEFIPAALMAIQPIAKAAIGIIGRPKVVGFLAKYLAKLISPYVGNDPAMGLSRAITDAGLRLVGLEATPEARATVAGEAVAAAVEETLDRVATQPEYVLENEDLLQGAVQEAFEKAAAAVFPTDMLKAELRETSGVNDVWVLRPTGRKKYYRKNTWTPEIMITPQLARSVKTFGGKTLADFLRDRLGLPASRPVKARVHLYEAIRGTWLSRISRLEKGVPGLGSIARSSWSQIHPLTPDAAAALLRQPGLGRPTSPRFLASRHKIRVGQRLYYLEIRGARPQVSPREPGQPETLRRSSEVNLTLDFPKDQIRTYIFLSEANSQEIAVKLRQNAPLGSVMKLVTAVIEASLNTALSGELNRHVKVVHETVYPDQFLGLGQAVKRLAPVILKMLLKKLLEWLAQRLTEYFRQRAQEFIGATTNPADGVTLVVTFTNPPGMSILRKALKGEFVNPVGDWFPKGVPNAVIEIVPGFRRG
jgi:hypothetical protein